MSKGAITGCVIQGNVREGLDDILKEMARHFDHVILSTWRTDENQVPRGKFELILNDLPGNPGLTNRNLQRMTTLSGLDAAGILGCTHVMKWRTDLLPTKLDAGQLLSWSEWNPQTKPGSRLVMTAFRNLSVDPDWFSTLPDLFAFGRIEMVKMLWEHPGIDLSDEFHVPPDMLRDCRLRIVGSRLLSKEGEDITSYFDNHVELYGWFRNNLETALGRQLAHPVIARDYLYLIDYRRLRICWFGAPGSYRSLSQAHRVPWWTEQGWRAHQYRTVSGIGYKNLAPISERLSELVSRVRVEYEQAQQSWYHRRYRRYRRDNP